MKYILELCMKMNKMAVIWKKSICTDFSTLEISFSRKKMNE